MRVVVCIKQVPETGDVKINPETNTLIREGAASIINPFDMYAIEEGIRIKERLGWHVTAISMGPPQAESALREAISMGINDAILLTDRAFAGSDTYATSYALSKAIKKIGDVLLVICGKQASDGDTAQVGPGIASHLDWPQITYVRKIEELDETHIVAERLMETGYEIIESPLPCVITVVKEINEPRLPSLKGKITAKNANIPRWGASEIEAEPDKIGLNGSPTKVVKIFSPPPRTGGIILKGDEATAAKELAEKLKDIILGIAK